MAGEIEAKLRITAQDTSAKAFRDVAAAVETMSARVTKSHRQLASDHKTLVTQFEEGTTKVGASLNSLTGGLAGLGLKAAGVSLGIGAIVEAGKKAVTVFATVDEQARALAVSTGRSEEAIAGLYERVKQVAGTAAVDADKLRDSFDDLAHAIGPEKAIAALPRLALAAKAMRAPIADVVGLTEQMNDNLDITVDKAPAAFDMIQKGTEGTRTTAAGATKGLADLSLQMRGLGEGGEKGLRSTLGMLVAVGKHAPSTEAAVASLQSLMNKVGTRKTDENLEKLGRVPMRATLDEAKRKHQDEFLVFLNEVDKALSNMATEAGTPIASKMQYLQQLIKSPEDRQAIQSILESKEEWRTIRDRKPAEEAGATEKAFETMRPGAASFLTKLGNTWAELFEAGGRKIWGTVTTQHRSTEAEKRPDLAAKGLLPPETAPAAAPPAPPAPPAPALAPSPARAPAAPAPTPPASTPWSGWHWGQPTEPKPQAPGVAKKTSWLEMFNPVSNAEAAEATPAMASVAPSAAPTPRKTSFSDISGNVSDLITPGMQGTRPLIPSEPGSSTERTAREQLEALRRLERASLFSGGLGATAAPNTPATGGGGTGAGEAPEGGTGGAQSRSSRTPGSREGGPGGGKPLVSGATPSGKGGGGKSELSESIHKQALEMGIPEPQARLAAAQAQLESAGGTSELATKANNLFGIKGSGDAGSYSKETTEQRPDGSTYRTQASFAAYKTREAGLRAWWNKIQKQWPDAAKAKTWEEAKAGLRTGQQGGYATDKNYVAKLDTADRGAAGAPGTGEGKFNYMHGQHGAPGENIQTFTTQGGRKVRLNAASAPHIIGFLNDLEKAGAPITHELGGFVNRNIAGSGSKSQHAYGNAVDVESTGRNVGQRAFGEWAANHQKEIREAERAHGMKSGADMSRPDFGHWEWGGGADRPSEVAKAPPSKPAEVVEAKPAPVPSTAPIDLAGRMRQMSAHQQHERPQHESQLEDFRRKAAEPVHVPVKFSYEDVKGIRDRGEAQGRRTFNRETKRARYQSFSDVGVV